MTEEIRIHRSEKVGLNSKESYVITRGKTSYLRILGGESEWELMTATASEDHANIRVCGNQLRLVEAALRLGTELDTNPTVKKDWMKREYVKICGLRLNSGEDGTELNRALEGVLAKFFGFYDGYQELDARSGDEMRELYETLAFGEQGGDVYLSDGVWLSQDGSLHDRGR